MKYLESIVNSGLLRYVKKSEYIEAYEHMDIIEKSYDAGEPVFYEGDSIDRLCIVRAGSVRSEKTYPGGEIHIASVFEEKGIFGLEIALSRKKTSPVDFIANEDCSVIMVTMRSLQRSPFMTQFQKALAEMMADENIRMMHKIEILAERGLRDRVLVYLNILSQKSHSDEITVRMSREQMAQYLCVNRSALSNELNKMKREGLIDFHRHQFRLLRKD